MVDNKASALTSLTAPTRDDLLYIVNDPAGTPTSYKTTVQAVASGPVLFVAASNASALATKNADYVCDGTADEAQINAAIAALPTPGGSVILSEGKFTVSSPIIINTEMYLVGQGKLSVANPYGTTITAANSSDTDIIEVTDSGSALYFQQIRGLKIDGNKSNMSSGRGIYFHGDVHDVVLFDLFVYDTKDQGIHILDDGHRPHNFRAWNVLIEECGGNGWEDNACDQIFMHQCYFYDNLRNFLTRGDYSLINSSHFYKSQRENVYLLTAHYNIMVGNYIDGSGTTVASPGITLENSDQNTIVGNFSGNEKGSAQTYGITLDASTANCLVVGNSFLGNVTAGVSDAGTGNMIQYNQGYVTENHGAAANVSDGGTIAHGCATTPISAQVTGSVAAEMISVTGLDGTNITVAIKDDAGNVGTQQTIYWRAWV